MSGLAHLDKKDVVIPYAGAVSFAASLLAPHQNLIEVKICFASNMLECCQRDCKAEEGKEQYLPKVTRKCSSILQTPVYISCRITFLLRNIAISKYSHRTGTFLQKINLATGSGHKERNFHPLVTEYAGSCEFQTSTCEHRDKSVRHMATGEH